jgi:GR25 family glycosyltransferase involved in LPS biosynthesis
MKVFVIHYKRLTERVPHMLEQFKRYNITDYEFIEIDRDELNENNKIIFSKLFDHAQIAICLSHFYAYRQISEKHEHALILEDDAILSDDFIQRLNKYIDELPNDYDALFLGDGCNMHIPSHLQIPEKHIYKIQNSRCTDSYLVSKNGATKLWNYICTLKYKINKPVDHWINQAFKDTDSNVYWAEPTIVTQGTQSGLFTPSHKNMVI